MTFSEHAAQTRASKLYYVLLFSVTLPLLYLFFVQWFIPVHELGTAFALCIIVSLASQYVCTYFPDDGSATTPVHRVLTGISGVALLPLLVIIAFSAATSVLMAISLTATLAMLCLLVFALKHQAGYKHAMLLQIGYYALFFSVILLMTYTHVV
jgi:hypothetical protein